MRDLGERLFVKITTFSGEVVWMGSVDTRDITISEPVPHISPSEAEITFRGDEALAVTETVRAALEPKA